MVYNALARVSYSCLSLARINPIVSERLAEGTMGLVDAVTNKD
jgi:hypothetical protein